MAIRTLSPLRRALLLWVLACVLLGTGLLAVLRRLHDERLEAAWHQAETDLATAEQTLLRAFDLAAGVQALLRIKHGLLDVSYSTAGIALDHHLRRTVANGRFGLVQASVVDNEGVIVWSSLVDGVGIDVSDREHVRVHLDNPESGPHVGRPVVGRASGRWSIQLSDPIRRPGETALRGIAVVALDPVDLSASLDQLVTGAGRRIVVRRLADGALLARSSDAESRLGRVPDPNHPIVVAARAQPRGRQAYVSRSQDESKLAAWRVLPGLPVVAAAVFERDEEMRSFWVLLGLAALGYVGVAAVGLRLGVLWARRREAQRELRAHAEQDPLTGLLNRRAMEQEAGRILASARRRGEPAAVLLLDLDHFKAINDGYGHAVGDQVLRDLAECVTHSVRADDLVCRWGGEELLVLLRDCNGSSALARADALRGAIEALYAGGRGPVPRITASIGAAIYPRHGSDLQGLVGAADGMLYTAKGAGRNRVVLAPTLETVDQRAGALETAH